MPLRRFYWSGHETGQRMLLMAKIFRLLSFIQVIRQPVSFFPHLVTFQYKER